MPGPTVGELFHIALHRSKRSLNLSEPLASQADKEWQTQARLWPVDTSSQLSTPFRACRILQPERPCILVLLQRDCRRVFAHRQLQNVVAANPGEIGKRKAAEEEEKRKVSTSLELLAPWKKLDGGLR